MRKEIQKDNRETILYGVAVKILQIKDAMKKGLTIEAYEEIQNLEEYIIEQRKEK